jgi:TPR repeat protein
MGTLIGLFGPASVSLIPLMKYRLVAFLSFGVILNGTWERVRAQAPDGALIAVLEESAAKSKKIRAEMEADQKRPDQSKSIEDLKMSGLFAGLNDEAEAARYWYGRAADKGDASSQSLLGRYYIKRSGEAERAQGIRLLTKAAAQNDEEATLSLLKYYLKTAPNETQAIYWMRKLNPEEKTPESAGMLLVRWLAEGRKVDKDPAFAIRLLMKLAEQGFAPAMQQLALQYISGNEALGIPKDWSEAERWLSKAAESGDDVSVDYLARIYAGADQKVARADEKKLADFLKRRAENGSRQAQHMLGELYSDGKLGFPKDAEAGSSWYRRAAEAGLPRAQYALGRLHHEKGEAEPAISWFRRAADGGDTAAQYAMGGLYWQGSGVAQNKEKALEYFNASAEAGSDTAQAFLGAIYLEGEGVPRDLKKGIKLLETAAAEGNAAAAVRLGRAYLDGSGVEKDSDAALRAFLIAAQKGDPAGLYQFAKLAYSKGETFKKEALVAYRAAADRGHGAATMELEELRDRDPSIEEVKVANPQATAAAYFAGSHQSVSDGNLARALARSERVVQLFQTTECYYLRAYIRNLRQNWDDALVDANRSIELTEDGSKKYYGQIQAWVALGRKGNLSGADKRLTEFLAAQPEAPATKWERRLASLVTGKISTEAALADVVDASPTVADSHRTEALCFAGFRALMTGDRAAARGHFERCVAIGLKNDNQYWQALYELKSIPGNAR